MDPHISRDRILHADWLHRVRGLFTENAYRSDEKHDGRNGGALCFWAVGFQLAFSETDSRGVIGVNRDWAFSKGWAPYTETSDLWVKFLFQYAFLNCASAIVSGLVTERVRIETYSLFMSLIATFTYPVAVAGPGTALAGCTCRAIMTSQDRVGPLGRRDFWIGRTYSPGSEVESFQGTAVSVLTKVN